MQSVSGTNGRITSHQHNAVRSVSLELCRDKFTGKRPLEGPQRPRRVWRWLPQARVKVSMCGALCPSSFWPAGLGRRVSIRVGGTEVATIEFMGDWDPSTWSIVLRNLCGIGASCLDLEFRREETDSYHRHSYWTLAAEQHSEGLTSDEKHLILIGDCDVLVRMRAGATTHSQCY